MFKDEVMQRLTRPVPENRPTKNTIICSGGSGK